MADWIDGIIERDFDAAIERGKESSGSPRALSVRLDRKTRRIVAELDNGCSFAFPANNVQGLEEATLEELADIELLGGGYALHWPRVNADIRIESALVGIFGSKKWMLRLAAQEAGKSTSEKKALAARTNGAKGGRPRKIAA